ncbi:sigma factor-like helix-turn-helix DNA-binding protein [Paenibacillus antibioticophila]|uniref:sigma factor-like helix-turn-helix DNA-binding protein n=1 Tax=Paenibacillus antibioticophila TaxID=1274374 RepID=UPI0021CBA33D|nr:sigma-70 family RNA polymerase sigma factor [Paenibacillus antibioticophila]
MKYMASLIHYNSINYDKKRQALAKRYPLVLNDDERLDSVKISCYDPALVPSDLKDHITDRLLFLAYTALSEKQQTILSLFYVQNLNDKEISIIMGGSQQNISKHRLKAISKLREVLQKSEEERIRGTNGMDGTNS